MPDPNVKPPVRTAKQGGKFVCVDATGKAIGESSYDSRDEADRACATINAAWKRAKRDRRANGSPAITEAAKYTERLHPRNRVGEFADVLGREKHAFGVVSASIKGHSDEDLYAKLKGITPSWTDWTPEQAAVMTEVLKRERKRAKKLAKQAGKVGRLKEALFEAVVIRKSVVGGEDFTLAFARERAIRELIESRHRVHVFFDPSEHPRDRAGQFVNVLAKLKAGADVALPGGITVIRKTGYYKVVGKGGSTLGRTRSAQSAAAAALAYRDWRVSADAAAKGARPLLRPVDYGVGRGSGRTWSRPSYSH